MYIDIVDRNWTIYVYDKNQMSFSIDFNKLLYVQKPAPM